MSAAPGRSQASSHRSPQGEGTPVTATPQLNLADMRRRKPEQSVPSPCISVCELDLERTRCKGCHRTLDEITAWGFASPARKNAILAAVARRQSVSVKSI